jgi:hypothetical protein
MKRVGMLEGVDDKETEKTQLDGLSEKNVEKII